MAPLDVSQLVVPLLCRMTLIRHVTKHVSSKPEHEINDIR